MDGSFEASLTRRSPGLAQARKLSRLPETTALPEEERFLATSGLAALAKCKARILELDGEILGEIPAPDEDEKID
jgi:hypothetical protein